MGGNDSAYEYKLLLTQQDYHLLYSAVSALKRESSRTSIDLFSSEDIKKCADTVVAHCDSMIVRLRDYSGVEHVRN